MAFHVAVFGSGDWCRVHLGALSESPHVSQVTLVGRNAAQTARLGEQFPIVTRILSDWDVALSDADIDVVHVVLPHHLHARLSLAALEAGKHVICEKPAATSLEDWDRTREVARQQNRQFLVVMNQLYNPVFQRMRQLVAADAIGRPFLSVENSFASAAKHYRNLEYWRNTPDRAGGGVFIDGGFHMVYRHFDTLAVAGMPRWVTAEASQLAVSAEGNQISEKGEDFISVTVGYQQPLRIEWAHGWTLAALPERSRQSFLAGTTGTLELTDQYVSPLVLHRAEGEEVIEVADGPRSGSETTHACLLDYLDCLDRDCLPERATLELARLALATILTAYRASSTGRRELIPGPPN